MANKLLHFSSLLKLRIFFVYAAAAWYASCCGYHTLRKAIGIGNLLSVCATARVGAFVLPSDINLVIQRLVPLGGTSELQLHNAVSRHRLIVHASLKWGRSDTIYLEPNNGILCHYQRAIIRTQQRSLHVSLTSYSQEQDDIPWAVGSRFFQNPTIIFVSPCMLSIYAFHKMTC